ncbi:MAG: SH3 beta-barrel fold-containing protein [Tannerellaceae bacterium]|nr:SH3 beta-barrel fold-containing protein [Tannerellaceae bacterium]
MRTDQTYKKQVFKMAHELMEATDKTFPVCLAKAWQLYRFYKRLEREEVVFAYERKDGSLRKAKGTLKNVQHLVKGTGQESYKTIRYYDLNVQGFRSFKIENLITTY